MLSSMSETPNKRPIFTKPLSDSRASPLGTGDRHQGSRELRDSSEQTHISPNDAATHREFDCGPHRQTWRRCENDRVESEGRDFGLE